MPTVATERHRSSPSAVSLALFLLVSCGVVYGSSSGGMASVPAATEPQAKKTAYVGGNALVDQPKEPGSVFPAPPSGVPLLSGDGLNASTAPSANANDEASPYVWLKLEKDGSWKPMWKKDSLALEEALALAQGGHNKTLLVEGGRYQVDVEAREMSPVYWKGDKRRVLRSLWFWRQQGPLPGIGPATWMPYEDNDNNSIESLYVSLCSEGSSAKVKEVALADGTHKVVATLRTSNDDKDKDKEESCNAKAEEGPSTSAAPSCAYGPSKLNNNNTTTNLSASTSVGVGEAMTVTSKWDLVQTRVNYGIGVLHNRALRRGYGPYVVEGEAEEEGRDVDHLVLVVHGIGEKLFANDDYQGMPSLKAAVDTLRKNTLAQQIARLEGGGGHSGTSTSATTSEEPLSSSRGGAVLGIGLGSSQRGGGNKESEKEKEKGRGSLGLGLDSSLVPGPWGGKRVEFIPVEWFHAVRQDEGELTCRIKAVTLPSVPMFRQFANDAVMDVLLYMNPNFRQRILTCVGETIVKEVQRYRDNNPSFKGHVSLIGHSLGSVILFDLLAHQRGPLTSDPLPTPLDPTIDYPQLHPLSLHTLLLMGSPLAMFLTLREAQLPPSFKLPLVSNFINLFHPHDPVAYRLEPLLLPSLVSLEPSLVPCHGPSSTNLVTKIRDQHKALSTLGSSWSSAFQGLVSYVNPNKDKDMAHTAAAALTGNAKEQVGDVSELGLNCGRRVDYSLQEGVIETANEYLSAMSSHSSYFGSLDVALFLAKSLRDIPSSTTTSTNMDTSAVGTV